MKPNIDIDEETKKFQPLAARMRPLRLDEFIGQSHLLGQNKSLRLAITQGALHSMILWGPPGTGKTTLAELMAKQSKSRFVRFSAILIGVKDIRQAVEAAKQIRQEENLGTVLFLDEIHRFNKAQQDVLLPFIEDGTFTLIGATTENPSFELNNALLSRVRVYVLQRLSEDELLQIVQNTLQDKEKGLGKLSFSFPLSLQKILVEAADGDARQALNILEMLADLAPETKDTLDITESLLSQVLQQTLRRFDKNGEAFYDQISALHKSVRGSAPDAALYWLCRMLDGGCDPLYIARRVIRMANEDIGLADPRAMDVAVSACEIYERLGSPEGELAIAEAIVYLSCAPKSNAVYTAFGQAKEAAKKYGSLEVPLHLRNAPTKLMKQLNYGRDYRYAHDEPEAYAAGEKYFPDEIKKLIFYHPVPRGLEIKIAERLAYFRELDKKAK
jgi:putative ATPase